MGDGVAVSDPTSRVDDDLRSLADSLPQLVWITRPDGYHIYFNARWSEYTGLGGADSFGDGWLMNALHPDDRQRTFESWTHSLRTGDHYEIEYRFRSANGEYRWFLGRALPQRDQHGTIIRWFGTCTDIQAQKAAEAALQESEAWFRTLVEGSADMFATLTLDTTYVYCSPSVEEQLGWRPDDLVGRTAFDFIHPDDTDRINRELAELSAIPSGRVRTQLKFRSRSGEWRDCDVTVRLVNDPDGRPLIIANSRDTTEAAVMRRRVEESERLAALGRVASAMAHEFNNVLMGIQPHADILKRMGDDRVKASATRIEHSVSRGKSISEQVLRFTRAEAPRLAPVAVVDAVNASVADVSLQLPPAMGLLTQFEEADLHISAESSHIEQTIVNLCLNARDAMGDEGTITLRVRRAPEETCRSAGLSAHQPGYVEVAVSDTGPGVPFDLRERIFEPLFSTKKRTGGSGIGLSIARQIAHAHHGALTLDAPEGPGATFKLILPLCPATQRLTQTSEEQVRVPDRVVIVEDDDLVAEGLLASLRSVGVSIRRVSCGADAAEAVRQFRPDVVLLDYSLGDMTGTEVYRAIKSTSPDMSVVFVTGHADAESVIEEIGRTDVIVCRKPVSLDQLLAAMEQAQDAAR